MSRFITIIIIINIIISIYLLLFFFLFLFVLLLIKKCSENVLSDFLSEVRSFCRKGEIALKTAPMMAASKIKVSDNATYGVLNLSAAACVYA